MRDVAVTEGNKVSAQIDFGYEVHGYGIGDLTASIDEVTDGDIKAKVDEYSERYVLDDTLKSGGSAYASLSEALRIEAASKTSSQRRLQGIHYHIRKSLRNEAAARNRRSESYGQGLRLRSRGGLENSSAAADNEGNG